MKNEKAKKNSKKQPGDNDGTVPPAVSGGRAFSIRPRPPHHRDGAGYLDGEGK